MSVMSDKVIANLIPQKPILQQDKSVITTNPFIHNTNEHKEISLQTFLITYFQKEPHYTFIFGLLLVLISLLFLIK